MSLIPFNGILTANDFFYTHYLIFAEQQKFTYTEWSVIIDINGGMIV